MDQFARTILGYHGCTQRYETRLLSGKQLIAKWEYSRNKWDWLGHGIYFWEHSPERAWRWAQERHASTGEKPGVIGAVIQLGDCFDLLNQGITSALSDHYEYLKKSLRKMKMKLPKNKGKDWKLRELDCLVINNCIDELNELGKTFDTVRGAFTEGEPVYPGAGFSKEAHIQIAVRNRACILGVLRPNLEI